MAPDDLGQFVADELFRPAPPAAERLSNEIRRRHGSAVAVVLFYGSCLRKNTAEGVLDFYAIVDDYRSAYRDRSSWLRIVNALLPPNVFFLEIESDLGPLRCKYAVMSSHDFDNGVRGGLRSSIWARFCQPALAIWVRDDVARARVTDAVAEAVTTAVERAVPLLPEMPETDGARRFDAETLWQRALAETYAAELRTESPETISGHYRADPERYQRATRAAIDRLANRGLLQVRSADETGFTVATGASRARPTSRPRWLLAKLVYALALLKSITTFGDWLPYVLWKLERHSGTHITLTERQRRHPLIWGWPVLFRVIWRRDLH